MTYIPSCYYHKSITKEIDTLIDDGYASYDDILDVDKDMLVARCIEVLGEDAYELIMNEDILSGLKRCIIYGKQEDSQDLVEVMKTKAMEYFSKPLTDLFEERRSFNSMMMNFEKPQYYPGLNA